MYTSDIVVDQVIDALADFITPFMPVDAEIVRAQVNRVAMPKDSCVVLTELLSVELETAATDYQPLADTATITGPTRIDIQADFYGTLAGEQCKAIQSASRTGWGYEQFPANIKPLYTSDGVQAPLTTGEQQYESRWTLTVSLQYNPSVTVPQQFADVLTPETVEPVDVFQLIT